MPPPLPRLHLLAAGGSNTEVSHAGAPLVGVQPLMTGVGALLAAVPELGSVAHITGEPFSQVTCHGIDTATLLALARRINTLLASADCDGVLITHGTNTLDETAYFLNLVIKSNKPVVLVGAMQPGTALSADGLMKLYRAAMMAASPQAQGRGVMLAMNDQILAVHDLHPGATLSTNTFTPSGSGH